MKDTNKKLNTYIHEKHTRLRSPNTPAHTHTHARCHFRIATFCFLQNRLFFAENLKEFS